MSNEQELMLHRCAIFGARGFSEDHYKTTDFVNTAIADAISEGFVTFVTELNDGFELDAAKFVCDLKKTNPNLHLIVVLPFPNQKRNCKTASIFNSILQKADIVKFMSKTECEEAFAAREDWIIKRCHRILSITNSLSSNLNRLHRFDLSQKEFIIVCSAGIFNENLICNQKKPTEVHQSLYPENLLCELLECDISRSAEVLSVFPENIAMRLETVLDGMSKSGERIKTMIMMRYSENKTLQEIGDAFGISRQRVSQLLKQAIRLLRQRKRIITLTGIEEAVHFVEQQLSRKWERWSTEEILELEREKAANISVEQIAQKHSRPRNAIIRMLKERNLWTSGDGAIRIDDILAYKQIQHNLDQCASEK